MNSFFGAHFNQNIFVIFGFSYMRCATCSVHTFVMENNESFSFAGFSFYHTNLHKMNNNNRNEMNFHLCPALSVVFLFHFIPFVQCVSFQFLHICRFAPRTNLCASKHTNSGKCLILMRWNMFLFFLPICSLYFRCNFHSLSSFNTSLLFWLLARFVVAFFCANPRAQMSLKSESPLKRVI